VQKIPTRLRGTNFCTSSARFAPSFIRQLNGPECTQMERNTPKRQYTVQCGGSDAFIAENSDTILWHKLLHYFCRFAPSFISQPNGHECTQIVQNTPTRQFRVQWGGLGAFVVKSSTRLRGTNFCTSSARFAPSFVRRPNGPECTQIV